MSSIIFYMLSKAQTSILSAVVININKYNNTVGDDEESQQLTLLMI